MPKKTLPPPTTDNQEVLYGLISERQITSVDLKKRFTKSSYVPARIADLHKLGISIGSRLVRYKNRRKKVSHIAQYTLLSPMKEAKEIYLSMFKKAA